ncbi:MAG: BtrH N-terminal domain-containing protein [Erysipelotrichaceae bacterium]|nr:BtrH N-terminal domain-containing protein [Erysipelotrichaceae bacterium]
MKKIVCNIKPFNEFPLSGCFKHQVLSALQSLNVNILTYITNSFYTYSYNQNYLKSQQIQFNSYSKNYKDMNIKMLHKKTIKTSIIKEIIKQIKKDRLVILPCDCYGLTYRKDMYNKLHSLHYILIYGYNDKNKSFYTIDHDYLNSFQYKKKLVKFIDIEKGFKAYKDNYYKKSYSLLYVIYKTHNKNNRSTTSFINNISNNKHLIKHGLYVLKQYINYFESLINNKKLFLKKVEKTYKNFVLIRQHKERQKYQLQYCFKRRKLSNILNKIIYEYTFLISIFYKCFLTKKHNYNSLLKCKEKLNTIYQLEERLIQTLYETIKSN